MNITHIWSVLCRESVINKDDNVISLNGVLEKITSELTPLNDKYKKHEIIYLPLNCEIVSMWTKASKESEKFTVKLTISDPKDKELATFSNDGLFPKESNRLRTRLRMNSIPASINGIYKYKVSVIQNEKEHLIATIPFELELKIMEPQKSK